MKREDFGRQAIAEPLGAAAGARPSLRDWSQRTRATAVQSLRYSFFVTVMKRTLPVAVVVIVGAVIAYSVAPRRPDRVALNWQQLGAIHNDLTMTKPRLTGTDAKGNPYTITVAEAIQNPKDPHQVSMRQVEADMQYNGGQNWASATAADGFFDMDAGSLKLGGGISLYTDSGYELHTKSAHVDLKKSLFTGQEKVKGHGPLGNLSADRFQIDRLNKQIHLSGHVHMIMYPKKARR
jgi:lipopolysaccharide export system protein LptC